MIETESFEPIITIEEMMYETVDLQNVVITHYQHLSESYQKNLLLLLFIYQELYDSSKPEY